MLATHTFGEASGGAPLVIAHGLFGSGRNWGVLSKRLADRGHVIAVDMRNHGESFWDDAHGYDDLARDLAQVIDAHGGRADVVGHSMGGKAAMALALAQPQAVDRLIVVDIAPVAYAQSQAPMIAAMQAVDLDAVDRRSDADAQLARTIPDPAIRAFLLQSLDVANRRWRLNLGALEREMDRIIGWPDPPGRFSGPTLFLRGGASDYVTDAAVAAAGTQFPAARVETLSGAGHWLHAEAPRETEAAIRAFLETAGRQTSGEDGSGT